VGQGVILSSNGYVFLGESLLSLDGKGRLTIPSRHRDVLVGQPFADEFVVTKHPQGCLLVLPRVAWEKLVVQLDALPSSKDRMRRLYMGGAVPVKLDGSFRVQLTPELRKYAGLDGDSRDAMLVGMGSRLEVWNAQAYAADEEAAKAESSSDDGVDLVF
jgi:MraZ protein